MNYIRITPLTRIATHTLPWLAFAAGSTNLLLRDIRIKTVKDFDFTSDYGITEWLINYQAGFTRRGLIGEGLHILHTKASSISMVTLIVTLSVLIYSVYVTYLIAKGKEECPAFGLPCAFIAGGPLYTDNVIRKDVLLLLLFAAMIHVTIRGKTFTQKAICANLFMTIGVLIHEMFAFLSFPAILFCLTSGANKRHCSIGEAVRNLVFMLPSLALFVAIATRHNVPHAAQIIHDSWQNLWRSSDPWPLDPGGSIAWLNKSLHEGISANLDFYARKYLGLPAIAWLSLNLIAGYSLVTLSIAFGKRGYEAAKRYLQFLALQLAALTPLFLIAIDSGRWAMMASASAFILLIEKPFEISMTPRLARYTGWLNLANLRGQSKANSYLAASLLLSVIGIPGIWWSAVGFVESAPLYQIWKLTRNLELTPALGELLHFLR